MITKEFKPLIKFEVTVGYDDYDYDPTPDSAVDNLIEELIVAGFDADVLPKILGDLVKGSMAVIKVREIQ